jgi:hypothetical protein
MTAASTVRAAVLNRLAGFQLSAFLTPGSRLTFEIVAEFTNFDAECSRARYQVQGARVSLAPLYPAEVRAMQAGAGG